MTIWVVFVVGISPLRCVVLYFNSTIGGTKFTQERLYGGGELLLVVAGIAAISQVFLLIALSVGASDK